MKFVFVLFCGLFCFSPPLRAGDNLLIIIADDLGADSFALTNDDPGAEFPALDSVETLASQGILFTNGYACPTCSPTRSTIMTGRYGFRTGVTFAFLGDDALSPEEYTFPEILSDFRPTCATAHIGKWHLGPALNDPAELGGWQHSSGCLAAAVPDYYSWPKVVDGVLIDENYPVYATRDNADDALTWMAARGTAGEPWLLWLAFNAPHTPYHKPPDGTYTPPRVDLLPDDSPGSGADQALRQDAYYRAMTEAMDGQIDRVLQAVDLSETNVIFLGDNGTPRQTIQPPYTANHAKGTVFEGGVRVPLIVAGPAVVGPNRTNPALVHSVDLFSTILELAGVDTRAALAGRTIDSRSFLPLLGDPALTEHRGNIYSETSADPPNPVDQRALRDDRYKLVWTQRGGNQFYDLHSDPNETNDLLEGTLTAEEQARYDLLVLKMDLLVNGFEMPALSSTSFGTSEVTLTIPALEAINLTLEVSTDLRHWQDTGIAPSMDGSLATFTYPMDPADNPCFLRVAGSIDGL